jgi:hypothetical protein
MKKLKLRMEELAVESFSTSDADDAMGTVHGQEMIPTPPYFTCRPCLLTRPTDCPCTPMI